MSGWSERRLRDYLWQHRDIWHDIVEPLPSSLVQETSFDVESVSPEGLLWELARRRIVDLYDDVRGLSLLGNEVRIASVRRGGMSMDLFGVPFERGAPGLGVVELKVSGSTSRESFTELLGYGQGLLLTSPGLCRNDLLHVLVAPVSTAPAIVRSALAASFVLDRRRMLALEPVFDTPVAGEVRLRPWIPSEGDLAPFGRCAFQQKHFYVAIQVWEGDDGWWHETAMNAVATRAALAMEAAGIHGFAFASRAYPELSMPLPNTLTCVGLNPFSLAHDLYSIPRQLPKTIHLNDMGLLDLRFSDVLPSLRRSAEAGGAADSVSSAAAVWSAHLAEIAYQTVRRAVQRSDGGDVEIDHGSFTWEDYLQSSESTRAQHFELVPTGMIREMYDLVVENDYRVFGQDGEHPVLGDDIFLHAEETMRTHSFFREFMLRMMKMGGSAFIEDVDDDA